MNASLPRRRLLGAVLSAAVVGAAALAMRREEPPSYTFRVTLGLTDRVPTDWNGHVAVTGGEVTELAGWRFEGKDAVQDKSGWHCRTHNLIEPGQHYAIEPAAGKPPPPPLEPWPNGVTLRLRGGAPEVALTLSQGEVKFAATDVGLGQPRTFLDGRVRVERLPETSVYRPAGKGDDAVQDDYPAFWVRYKTGKHVLRLCRML